MAIAELEQAKYVETQCWWIFFYKEDGVEVSTGHTRQEILDMAPKNLEDARIYKQITALVPVNHSVKDGVVGLDA